MKIAVIDDGVNSEFFSIGELCFDIEIFDDTHIQKRENKKSILNHGTVCAGIIRLYAPNAQIGSIKIMDFQEQCSCEQLITALNWCYDNDIYIVHLSIGSSKMTDYISIRKAVNKLVEKNIIIVAAFNNSGQITFPASFTSVIGVRNSEGLTGNEYFINDNSYNNAFIIASGAHKLLMYGTLKETNSCNSYSAPLITAVVHNVIDENGIMPIYDIKKIISGDKTSNNKNFYPYFFNEAVLVNLSEENLYFNPFFSVIKYYDKFTYSNIELDKKEFMVIIPSKINNSDNKEKIIFNILKNNSRYISGLLYVGVAPNSIESLCINDLKIPFMDEKNKKHNYLQYFDNGSLDDICGPIISVKGTYKYCIKLVCEINKMFDSIGYNSKAVSCFEKSYLYDIEYISTNIINKSNIIKLFNYYNLELLILNSNRKSNDNIYDIIIYVDKNAENIVYLENKIIVPENYTDEDIENIFNHTLNKLT